MVALRPRAHSAMGRAGARRRSLSADAAELSGSPAPVGPAATWRANKQLKLLCSADEVARDDGRFADSPLKEWFKHLWSTPRQLCTPYPNDRCSRAFGRRMS